MADYGALHRAVGALLSCPKKRIHVGPVHYDVRAPCLLRQLEESIASSSSGHGGRTSPGTRAPLNQDALDLWTEILLSIGAWAGVLGIDRAKYRKVRDVDENSPPPAGLLLRAVAAAIASRTDRDAMAAAVERNCHRWAKRIEAMLSPPVAAGRGIVGAKCRDCGETWVVSLPAPEPGQPDKVRWVPAAQEPSETRQPAIWVEKGETGWIRCLWCRSCSRHTWRDDLAAQAAEHDERERRREGLAMSGPVHEADGLTVYLTADGGYVMACGGCWLPGVYPDVEAALAEFEAMRAEETKKGAA